MAVKKISIEKWNREIIFWLIKKIWVRAYMHTHTIYDDKYSNYNTCGYGSGTNNLYVYRIGLYSYIVFGPVWDFPILIIVVLYWEYHIQLRVIVSHRYLSNKLLQLFKKMSTTYPYPYSLSSQLTHLYIIVLINFISINTVLNFQFMIFFSNVLRF